MTAPFVPNDSTWYRPAELGHLTGLDDAAPGRNLQVLPYVLGGRTTTYGATTTTGVSRSIASPSTISRLFRVATGDVVGASSGRAVALGVGVGVLLGYCGAHFFSIAERMLCTSAPELYSCIVSRATSTHTAQPKPCVSPFWGRIAPAVHLLTQRSA